MMLFEFNANRIAEIYAAGSVVHTSSRQLASFCGLGILAVRLHRPSGTRAMTLPEATMITSKHISASAAIETGHTRGMATILPGWAGEVRRGKAG